jgi:hypothetical protein
MVTAERAIRDAVLAVEQMPADVRLTEAVILLGQAQEKVANFVDGVAPSGDDARLVAAAAPDLYAAIKSAMEYLEEHFGVCREGCACIMHDLRAAIAKAEGQSDA